MNHAAEKFKEDPEYRPYCLMCDTIDRMQRTTFGFQCHSCYNTINEDMTHSDEDFELIEDLFAPEYVEKIYAIANSYGPYGRFGKMIAAEAIAKMVTLREDPVWANQGRKKKGGRSRY